MFTIKSPKKNVADTTCRNILTIEFKMNTFVQDFKGYHEQISFFSESIEKIEKASKNEIQMTSHDLYKEFSDAQSKISKLNKEVEATQTRFLKVEADFIKKLLEPLGKGDFNQLPQAELEKTIANIKKDEKDLAHYKRVLDDIIDKCQDITRHIASLDNSVKAICLPAQIEEATKISEKLTERMESLGQAMTSISLSPTKQCNPQQISNTFLQLFSAQQKRGQVLNKIQSSLSSAIASLENQGASAAAASQSHSSLNH